MGECFSQQMNIMIQQILAEIANIVFWFFIVATIAFAFCLVGSGGTAAAVCLEGYLSILLALFIFALIAFVGLVFIAAIFVAFDCLVNLILGPLGAVADLNSGLFAGSLPQDCPSALEGLEAATRQLEEAERNRNLAADRARRARSNLRNAILAGLVATAALAAAFFRPDLWPALVVAIAAAAALVVRRGRQLAQAEAELALAEARLIEAAAAFGAAKALALALCQKPGESSTGTLPSVTILPGGSDLSLSTQT